MSAPELPQGSLRMAPGFRFQFEPAQDAHVLLFPEGMIKLSGSASAILSKVDGERGVGDIVAALKAEFPDADLEADVLEFLAGALGKGWLKGD